MIAINLLPWREAEQKLAARRFMIGFIISVSISCLVVVFSYQVFAYKVSRQERRIRLLEKERQDHHKQLDNEAHLISLRDALETKLAFLSRLDQQKFATDTLLKQLVDGIPHEVFYTDLILKNNDLQLRGFANTNAQVRKLLESIREQDYLVFTELDEINKFSLDQELIINFTIISHLNL